MISRGKGVQVSSLSAGVQCSGHLRSSESGFHVGATNVGSVLHWKVGPA